VPEVLMSVVVSDVVTVSAVEKRVVVNVVVPDVLVVVSVLLSVIR